MSAVGSRVRWSEHRHLAAAVAAARRLDHVVLQIEGPCCGWKSAASVVRIREQPIGAVREVRIDRRRVADEADAAAGDQPAVGGEQTIDSGATVARSAAVEGMPNYTPPRAAVTASQRLGDERRRQRVTKHVAAEPVHTSRS